MEEGHFFFILLQRRCLRKGRSAVQKAYNKAESKHHSSPKCDTWKVSNYQKTNFLQLACLWPARLKTIQRRLHICFVMWA
jgi:hypothetical protein